MERTILWKRLDVPGHEAARVTGTGGGWRLDGTAVFLHEGDPWRLDYRIECDAAWRTRSGSVAGWGGGRTIEVAFEAGADGRWHLNGEERPAVEGCVDVDLNFSPSTNLLPIRRLRLAVGDEAEVRAAWLRFPGFTLEPLAQSYRRTEEHGYRYESGGGTFTRDLAVDEAGLVRSYPGIWTAEPPG